MYRPVGVDRAMLMSACGRSVRVGFDDSAGDEDWGVMEERKSGHSTMAFESVLRRMGRYVNLVYCSDERVSGEGGWA